MSRCGDQNDIFVYVLNVFIGIAIAVYFLPCKKNHPVGRYVGTYLHGWRNPEGGTGRDLPLRAPLISFPRWDKIQNQYITKWALFTSLGLFFSNCNSCIRGFGPFETLGDPFPRGPQGLVPPPLESFLQPCLPKYLGT